MLHNWTNILSTIPRHLPTRLQWILKMIRILGPWPCPAQAGPNNEWGQACPSPSPKWRMLDILRQWMMNGCLLSHVSCLAHYIQFLQIFNVRVRARQLQAPPQSWLPHSLPLTTYFRFQAWQPTAYRPVTIFLFTSWCWHSLCFHSPSFIFFLISIYFLP